jgi:alkylhydroperoxidase/carboxymuconolactone decarboxylase family protein YurZ
MTAPLDELQEVLTHFPGFWSEAGTLFTDSLYAAVDLERKTIELILLSLLAGRRWETGVRVHTDKALEHGATPAEIRGAILLSFAVFGTSSAVQGLHWAEDALAAHETAAADLGGAA